MTTPSVLALDPDDPKLIIPKKIASGHALTDDEANQIRAFLGNRNIDTTTTNYATVLSMYGGPPMVEALANTTFKPQLYQTTVEAIIDERSAALTGCGNIPLIVLGDSVAVPDRQSDNAINIVEDLAATWPTLPISARWAADSGLVFESVELHALRGLLAERLTQAGVKIDDASPWLPQTQCPVTSLGFQAEVTVLQHSHHNERLRCRLNGTKIVVSLPGEPSDTAQKVTSELITRLETIDQIWTTALTEVVLCGWCAAMGRIGRIASRHNQDLRRLDPVDAASRVDDKLAHKINVPALIAPAIDDVIGRVPKLLDRAATAAASAVTEVLNVEGPVPSAAVPQVVSYLETKMVGLLTGSRRTASPPPGMIRRCLETAFPHDYTIKGVSPSSITGWALDLAQTALTDANQLAILYSGEPVVDALDTSGVAPEVSPDAYQLSTNHEHQSGSYRFGWWCKCRVSLHEARDF